MLRVLQRPAVWMPLTVLLLTGLLILLLGPVAWWATPAKHLQGKDKADVHNATRQTLLAAVGGLVVLTGAAFTARTYYLSRRGQFTGRYTTAIGQLASDKLTERLGGIYALEHLMVESDRDHNTVVEVLAAFVRERTRPASTPPATVGPIGAEQIASVHTIGSVVQPTDVQAALTVLGRRPHRSESNSVDLARTDLCGADLAAANLQRAELTAANLQGADLSAANLQGADLVEANLQGADLVEANLQRADLTAANLQRADLEHADLQGGYLGEARLTDAYLAGAHLQGVQLFQADLQRAGLGKANLQDAKLLTANLQAARLVRANLERGDLRGANLQGADLTGVNMERANLTVANLQRADLTGANLRGAELDRADLRGAELDRADLRGAQLQGAIMDSTTRASDELREAWAAAQSKSQDEGRA
ncbi:pentapeptide repeat-containing protein [Micromonospora sp. NPDC047753]|uniref:pentapeptide repeat-containing protein n=1 Tax=Micromonospora sp. NPDC047753 TaxID=3154817 RepID=UPI0033D35F73